jgi:(S)-2-hydroxy-acid oxidase
MTDAGYEALVVTVDMPVMGNRLNERKIPVVLPAHLRLANFPVPEKRLPSANVNRQILDARTAADADAILATVRAAVHDPTLSWDLIARLRTITKMKIILKGVMAAEDARLAIEKGADAIIVSNHGGRQLDCTPATIEVLPAIAKEAKGKIPIIIDGGVRRGSDIFKAIALGADLVLVGRPVLWGLAYNGQEGVETVAHILEREFSRTMALAGVTKVEDIPKAILTYKPMARL